MAVEPSIPGKRSCLSCDRIFLSKDKMRIRRCDRCKKKAEESYQPRVIRTADVNGAIRHYLGDP